MTKNKKGIILDCTDKSSLLTSLKEHKKLYSRYRSLNRKWQEHFVDYCLGKKTLPITYDPFFKRIFHPDIHPERLSRLISSLLEIPVKVIKMLPSEETLLDGGALLILDILVELEDGALANVEVQKIPYLFPGERMSCYSSDLVLRQYSRVRGEKGNKFKYGDLKKVYTIVILEESLREFHECGHDYLHKGKTVFDTGLELELLQEYCLLALDVFRERPYPKDRSEQSAWISFLATDSLETAQTLMEDYPWLREIYEEMADYLHRPEEVLGMFSEALKIMDENTVQYMIELQQQQLEEAKERLDATKGELDATKGELDATKGQLDEAKGQLDETKGELDATKGQLDEAKGQLDETKGELDATKGQLQKSIEMVVKLWTAQGLSGEEIEGMLQKEFGMSPEEAGSWIGS